MILAIAGALVVPMMGDTASTKLRSAARLLAADIDYTQVESIAHGDDPRVLVLDQTNHKYFIAAKSDPATPITNPIGHEPYTTTFGQGRAAQLGGVTISSYSLGGDAVLGFGIFGQLDQTTDATITLAMHSQSVTITVDPTTGESSVGDVH